MPMQTHEQTSKPPIQLTAPRFEDLGPRLIVGVREHYLFENIGAIPAQWMRWVPRIPGIPHRIDGADYGVSLSAGVQTGFDYLCGVEVAEDFDLPQDLELVRIPPARYAVFAHTEHVSHLCKTIQAICRDWLPSSGLRLAADCSTPGSVMLFERYSDSFNPETGLGGMEVWTPVHPAEHV